MLTEHQITLVQGTWKKVIPISHVAADLFYTKLFELDPSLRPLFSDNMAQQKQKLMQMIGVAVGGLNNLEAIVPAVEDLGRRHVAYQVTDEHYDTVAAALLDTLDKGLGDDFTDEVREAWTDTYVLLATTMKNAAATVS
ncbi:hemin receptor [Planctomycetales bacterium ZRK34]|nr:hemin receptor [Planctomycetales bacterium ZRK34]